MKINLINILLIIALTCCDNSTTNKALIKDAENYMNDVTNEADKWLTNFNENGYAIFLEHKFPPPFEKLIEDSIKSSLQYPTRNVIDSIRRNEVQIWTNRMEEEYGAVRERKFKGIHIITKGKLFTFLPGKMKGFKEMNFKILGLKGVEQLYIKKVEGTYAILMYESKPTKKMRAEELIMLFLVNDKWTFLTYKIADDI